MIREMGKVIITEHEVVVRDFTFEGVDSREAQQEALAWALARLTGIPVGESLPGLSLYSPTGERVL